ncbi:MAG: LON peptidase substrate-binding domain-containing protein, partial [Alphaproteobacteria bacterium]|nr:LON peptidase substrate-binding domain-containing protein [Alphaproteobacteria bacterium]
MTDSDDKKTETKPKAAGILPVLPLRNIVVFPDMIVPLFVGRQKSIYALKEVMAGDNRLMLVSQKRGELDKPTIKDIYQIGTVGTVLQLLELPDGTVKVLVKGLYRAQITEYLATRPFFKAELVHFDDDGLDNPNLPALVRSVIKQFNNYVKLNQKIPPEVHNTVKEIRDPVKLADTVAAHLNIKMGDKQEVLETRSIAARLESMLNHLENEAGLVQVEKKNR